MLLNRILGGGRSHPKTPYLNVLTHLLLQRRTSWRISEFDKLSVPYPRTLDFDSSWFLAITTLFLAMILNVFLHSINSCIQLTKTRLEGHVNYLNIVCFCRGEPSPVVAATDPGLEDLHDAHPSCSKIIFLANISPKPSITPFTNGKSMLIASEDKSAFMRVFVDRDESKMAMVAV